MKPRNICNHVRRKHQPSLSVERLECRKLMCADLSFAAFDSDLSLENPGDVACAVSESGVAPNSATVSGGKVGGSLDAVGNVSLFEGLTASGRDRAFADIGDHVSITGGLAGGIGGGDSIFRFGGDVQLLGSKLGVGIEGSVPSDVDVTLWGGLAGGMEGSGIIGSRIGEEIPT